MHVGVAAMENNMKVPQKTENRTTTGPSKPTPGYIIIKEAKTLIPKDAFPPVFIAALFIIATIWKQAKSPSTDEWIRKMWYIQWNTS